MKKAETKAQVLSRWTQDSVEIFTQVCTKWENFNTLLSRHKQDINQQVIAFIIIRLSTCKLILVTYYLVGQSKIKQPVPDYQVYI
jgi:hypothetical protein